MFDKKLSSKQTNKIAENKIVGSIGHILIHFIKPEYIINTNDIIEILFNILRCFKTIIFYTQGLFLCLNSLIKNSLAKFIVSKFLVFEFDKFNLLERTFFMNVIALLKNIFTK